MKNKNSYIELWRFLACMIIFAYHTNTIFASGWLFVEFFFMLSGFFAYKHIQEKTDTIDNTASFPLQYTMDKFKRLLPYTIVGVILHIIYIATAFHLKGIQLIKLVLFFPLEALLLDGTGVIPQSIQLSESYSTFFFISSGLWFVFVMFIAFPVMLYLILYLKKKIGPWLITFFPLLLYGVLIIKDGTITGWHPNCMGVLALDLRALAGLLLGGAIYELSKWWKKWNFKTLGVILISLLEFSALGIACVLTTLYRTPYEVFVILLFILSLSLCVSGQTCSSRINSKILNYLGRISFPFYCFHCPLVLYAQKVYSQNLTNKHILILFAISLLLSVVAYGGVSLLSKPCKTISSKLKSCIIHS